MKKISIISALFLVLSALFGGTLSAQELKVVAFEARPTDLKAKLNPRLDLNDDPAALIRVQVAAPGCLFKGNIVGDVQDESGEYLVYMGKGSRHLRIYHQAYLFVPLDYEIPLKIESNQTYLLKLEVPIYTHYAEILEQQGQNHVKQSQNRVETNTYQVGDYYNENGKEGIVFWVDETGKHGKIVSMTESSSRLQWSSDKNEQRRLIGADDQSVGAKNMAVVKRIPGWELKYPAFKWCADLGEGWYLPAKEELKQIFEVKERVNSTLMENVKRPLSYGYWSSSEGGHSHWFCAWYVYVGNGDSNYINKYYYNSVRAVSAF